MMPTFSSARLRRAFAARLARLTSLGALALTLGAAVSCQNFLVADNPGASLLHCHMQQHMDYGLKTLITYA